MNPNFAEIWDAVKLGKMPKGYKLVSQTKNVSTKGFTKTNGTAIKGSMQEIILKKL